MLVIIIMLEENWEICKWAFNTLNLISIFFVVVDLQWSIYVTIETESY